MNQRAASIEVWYGWVVIGASLAIGTIAMAAPNILFVSLKAIAADFGWPRAGPSTAFALLMIGSGVGGIAMGWWMDKRGVMQPVLFGSVMIGIGAMVASHSGARWDFYLANGLLLGAFGEAAMIAPLIANATRWFDRRRGLAVAILASAQGTAGAIWPPVVRFLNDSVGWRNTYLYFGFFALATLIPIALLLKPRPPIAASEAAREYTEGKVTVLGYSPKIVQGLFCVAVIGCCTAMAMPIVHLISHATDLGFSRTTGANMLAVLFGASFFSRISFGLLADRIGGVKNDADRFELSGDNAARTGVRHHRARSLSGSANVWYRLCWHHAELRVDHPSMVSIQSNWLESGGHLFVCRRRNGFWWLARWRALRFDRHLPARILGWFRL